MDLTLWVAMSVVCGGLGVPLALQLPCRLAWRLALAPTLGTSVLAILVPIAYRFGASMKTLLVAFAIIAIIALIGTALHLRARGLPRDRLGRKFAAAWLVVSLALLAPRWVGGDQFAVFQGNQWDTYGYLNSAIAYATKPYGTIHRANKIQQLRNPFFATAKGQLDERPSVHELYAMFSRVAPGQAYRLYYAFLVWFMAQLVLVGLFVVRNAVPRASPLSWGAISIAFPLGFWGQYVFDINAWSQIASAPLLFAVFGLVLLSPLTWQRRDAWRLAAILAIVVAGAAYLYPEGFFIYTAALVPVAVFTLAWPMLRARQLTPSRFIPLIGYSGVLVAALYPPVMHFLLRQVTWSASNKVPWWHFFQRFFIGRDNVWGDGVGRIADFVAGTFGCYFATPKSEDALLQRVVLLFGIVGLVIALVRVSREPDVQVRMWVATAAILILPAAYLARDANYWAAGKVLSYAAPIFVTALCLSITRRDGWRWFAIAFVALQLVSALVRIPASRWHGHSGFAAPYPAVQNLSLKTDLGWDLRGLEPLLDEHSKVIIHPADPWEESALLVFMTARGVPFVKQTPVTATPGGAELGNMPMPWTPTIELSVRPKSIVLDYADGRAPVTVMTR